MLLGERLELARSIAEVSVALAPPSQTPIPSQIPLKGQMPTQGGMRHRN